MSEVLASSWVSGEVALPGVRACVFVFGGCACGQGLRGLGRVSRGRFMCRRLC